MSASSSAEPIAETWEQQLTPLTSIVESQPIAYETLTLCRHLPRKETAVTIAACYVSPKGIVLGADSTTTYTVTGGAHYLNHSQKLFEIGKDGTLGIVTWGLGGPARQQLS
jgi:hypothetical protein